MTKKKKMRKNEDDDHDEKQNRENSFLLLTSLFEFMGVRIENENENARDIEKPAVLQNEDKMRAKIVLYVCVRVCLKINREQKSDLSKQR